MSGGHINRINYEKFLLAFDVANSAAKEAIVAKSEAIVAKSDVVRVSSKLVIDKADLQTSITNTNTKFDASVLSEKTDKSSRIVTLNTQINILQTNVSTLESKNSQLHSSLNNIVDFLTLFRQTYDLQKDGKEIYTASEISTYEVIYDAG